MVRALGDRVRDWIPFDEPGVLTRTGYLFGAHAPGICDRDAFLRAIHVVNRPVLEITGSGRACGDARDRDDGACEARCIDFHRSPLAAPGRAIEDGCDVRSYHVWSRLDHFGWREGRGQRSGPARVNCATADRTLEQPGRQYGRVAAENAVEV